MHLSTTKTVTTTQKYIYNNNNKKKSSVFLEQKKSWERACCLLGYTPTAGEKPVLISGRSNTHAHTRTHKVTLLFPPSAYDLLISTASLLCHGELYLHRCCMSEEQTRLQGVCRCRTLKDVASGASSVTFSHPTPPPPPTRCMRVWFKSRSRT